MKTYNEAVMEVLKSFGCLYSPATLLGQWAQFVDWCTRGYRWDYSEYLNELGVRNRLQLILDSTTLQSYPELEEFKRNLEPIDNRFKELLNPKIKLLNWTKWWEQGILKKGGKEYVEFMWRAHKIDVELAS